MATASKQYKAIGEDLWKGRTEKIVSLLSTSMHAHPDMLRDDRTQSSSP